ncbi:hypothetical protein Hamer_G031227, partial [Homarus americanus]
RSEALTLAQLIRYNCIKHKRRNSSTITVRHCRNQETPFSLYFGMMIHAHSRNRGIIDKLFQHGICVSYVRVLQLSARSGQCCAVDNLDQNPFSNTATDSFHGTGISLFQHPDFDGRNKVM